MKGNLKPAVVLFVLVGAIALSATGNMPSLEGVIPDWVAVPALVGALAIIGMAFRDAFKKHPRGTPTGIVVIVVLTVLMYLDLTNR